MITIDHSRCRGCGECVSECPTGAITLVEGTACVDEAICEGCEICLSVCPHDAIISVETVELVFDSERLPDPEPVPTGTTPGQMEQTPRSGGEVLPAVGSILVSTGREVLPRLASMALDLLDQRIRVANSDSQIGRTQSRQKMSTQQTRGRRRRRRRRHGNS